MPNRLAAEHSPYLLQHQHNPVDWFPWGEEAFDKARREGRLGKLRYLLYEDGLTQNDARKFRGLEGVLLQSKPADDGKSCNPYIAALM